MSDSAQIKADIIPYDSEYAMEVRSWIDSEETYFNICEGKGFPPPENLIATWQKPDMSSYLLLTQNQPVAYADLSHPQRSISAEILHTLVAPQRRYQGYGSLFLQLLYDRAAQRSGILKVIINIKNENPEMLSCALKAGFELSGTPAGSPGLRLIKVITK